MHPTTAAEQQAAKANRRVVMDGAKPGNTKCLGCGFPQKWAEQMKQFWRARKRGLSEDQAKDACPRCQKCMTIYLREPHAASG